MMIIETARASMMAALLLVAAPQAFAQGTNTPGIDATQQRQEQRIQNDAASGKITQGQQQRLDKGQEHIQSLKDKAAADGSVNAHERNRIREAQERQAKRIHKDVENDAHRKHEKKAAE